MYERLEYVQFLHSAQCERLSVQFDLIKDNFFVYSPQNTNDLFSHFVSQEALMEIEKYPLSWPL